MSVDCALYIGYTVNLKTNLKAEDFEFFCDERFNTYDKFDCEGRTKLLIDGMNGDYTRLIFVDKKILDIWECDEYIKLRCEAVPDDVYVQLNKAYMDMYGKELDKNLIEYALNIHFS